MKLEVIRPSYIEGIDKDGNSFFVLKGTYEEETNDEDMFTLHVFVLVICKYADDTFKKKRSIVAGVGSIHNSMKLRINGIHTDATFSSYKEPYPGAFGSNPFSGSKKQKAKKGGQRGVKLVLYF